MAESLRRLLARWLASAASDEPSAAPNQPFDPDDTDNWTGLDYVHDRVIGQLDRQEARWKEVDDRLRFLLGVIGVIFAAGGGFMRFARAYAVAGLATFSMVVALVGQIALQTRAW